MQQSRYSSDHVSTSTEAIKPDFIIRPLELAAFFVDFPNLVFKSFAEDASFYPIERSYVVSRADAIFVNLFLEERFARDGVEALTFVDAHRNLEDVGVVVSADSRAIGGTPGAIDADH